MIKIKLLMIMIKTVLIHLEKITLNNNMKKVQ